MNNAPIGIFDSGVGGLSILSEMQSLLPLESFIYVADQAFMPYGAKSSAEIQTRAQKISQFLEKEGVKMIVVACNTATIVAVDKLRELFRFPIIGVVPVIKTATEKTKTKKIAVFTTPSTAESLYLEDLIKKFGRGMIVCKDGATGLEILIESGDLTNPQIEKTLKQHLLPLKNSKVDVIALGCTHYPFLRSHMQKIVGDDILILDSGGAVARRVKAVLHKEKLLAETKNQDLYYTSGNTEKFQDLAKKLLAKEINKVNFIQI